MAVTIHHLEPSPAGCGETYLRPGLSNLTEKFKSLTAMCQWLGITPDEIEKIGDRGVYPCISSQASHRTPEFTTAVRIKGRYLLLTWEGGDERYAEHCIRFDNGSRPFTAQALKNPPPLPPKAESRKSFKEWWQGPTNQTPHIYT